MSSVSRWLSMGHHMKLLQSAKGDVLHNEPLQLFQKLFQVERLPLLQPVGVAPQLPPMLDRLLPDINGCDPTTSFSVY